MIDRCDLCKQPGRIGPEIRLFSVTDPDGKRVVRTLHRGCIAFWFENSGDVDVPDDRDLRALHNFRSRRGRGRAVQPAHQEREESHEVATWPLF